MHLEAWHNLPFTSVANVSSGYTTRAVNTWHTTRCLVGKDKVHWNIHFMKQGDIVYITCMCNLIYITLLYIDFNIKCFDEPKADLRTLFLLIIIKCSLKSILALYKDLSLVFILFYDLFLCYCIWLIMLHKHSYYKHWSYHNRNALWHHHRDKSLKIMDKP